VSAQDPPADSDIERGDTVTITYRDSIRLPSFLDQPFADTCSRLERLYKMTCQAVPGDPATGGKQGGQIQAQEPVAGTLVKMGATITVRYYVGETAPGSVVGTDINAACAALEAQGHRCVRTEGQCAWQTGHAVGEVSNQSPAGGTQLPVGTDITLTYYSDKCPLGDYRNTAWEPACNEINRLGFQCNPVQVLHPTPGVVVAQDPVGGTPQLGTMVTIHWSPWTPVPVALGTAAGMAYPPGTAIPYARTIFHYTCDKGGTRCRGLPENNFYSALAPGSPSIDTDFDGAPAAVLMTCGTAAGQRRVWRTWNGGSPRHYQHVVSETPPPADDVEQLGCIW
jgi:beta-lactam-binding protein with PASTA domain